MYSSVSSLRGGAICVSHHWGAVSFMVMNGFYFTCFSYDFTVQICIYFICARIFCFYIGGLSSISLLAIVGRRLASDCFP